MDEAVVATQNLTKSFGETTVVDRVGLQVGRGEVYGFLGPNGAGKTTTLRMLTGLTRPSRGSLTVLGGDPTDPDVRARVGALVETPGFYPYLSGRDNLRVLARYRGLQRTEVEDRLRQVGLRHRSRDRFRTYSLGMRQRLGVAAALLGEPDLLILDEPTNGLDPQGMAEMRVLLRHMTGRGHSVVLSSHLLGEVQQTCDRVGVIVRGSLVAQGTVADLRGTSTVLVRASPASLAAQAARAAFDVETPQPNAGSELRVRVDPTRVPDLVRALVSAGADVHEVRPVERTLEQAFLEMAETREAPGKPS